MTRLDPMTAIAFVALAAVFRWLMVAKDQHIAELRETVRYQRSLNEVLSGTAHRAVGTVERLA